MKIFTITRQSLITLLLLSVLVLGVMAQGCVDSDTTNSDSTASISSWGDPSYAAADYNFDYSEWRWYFDLNISENAGVGLTIQELSIAFYSMDGILEHEADYTNQITDWFGSTWLNAYGTLTCRGTFWINNYGNSDGWIMVYTFTGLDEYNHVVTSQCQVTCGPSL
jgi:hypothetical protein